MKKIIVLAAVALMAALAGPALAAEGEGGADAAKPDAAAAAKEKMTDEQKAQADNLFGMFQEKLKHRYAPVIRNVTIGAARVGQPVDVTLKASYDTPTPIDHIVKAAVFYRLGDSGRLYGPVALKSAGGDTYKGSIPAVAKPGRLIVIPWVKDSYGNVGVEIPCAVSTWPPFEDPCMAPGAVDPDPLDDPAALIEDDFDVWEFQVGMDDKYIYLMTDVEGEVSKGTMNPPHINAYLSMLADTTELYGFDDLTVFMSGGGADKFKGKEDKASMIFYAPLATSFGMKDCFIPKFSGMAQAGKGGKPGEGDKAGGEQGGDKAAEPAGGEKEGEGAGEKKEGGMDMSKFMDTEHVKCNADGSTLFTRLDKSVISDTMKKSLSIVGAIDGYIDNPQMPLPKLREILPITKATYNPHVVDVK